ncbi:MAG: hypothetical protein ABIH99_02145 [Candidatus Micrarchaeota archaeon]
MKEILLRRLLEIKESLVALEPKLDKKKPVYKQVRSAIAEIDKLTYEIDSADLPREVRVDSAALSLSDGALSGKLLMCDGKQIHEVEFEHDKVINSISSDGDFKKFESLQNSNF